MRRYYGNSIQLNREKLSNHIGSNDPQVSEMMESNLAMEGNSHNAKTYIEWCVKDAQRIGDSAYVIEDNIDDVDFCCIMRKLGNG